MEKGTLSKDFFILLGGLWGGGAEKIAVEVANNLPSSISRILITIYDSGNKYSVSVPHISLSGKHMSLPARMVKLPLNYIRYIILLGKYHPKVSLSILPEDNVLNIITTKLMGVKPIISFHGMPSNKTSHIFVRFFLRLSLVLSKIFDVNIVAVSGGVKKELVELYGVPEKNIHVIYNPIDILNISRSAAESVDDFPFSPEVKTIITVGRLHPVKGHTHILRVFAELKKTHNVQLLIIGEGEELDYLSNLADELKVSDAVYFLGWQENPYKYMSRSDVFVLSSLSESFGNVLVESMACGCPVVASNYSDAVWEIVGENEEYGLVSGKMSGVKHSAGEMLDDGELSLKMKIGRLLDDEDLCMRLRDAGLVRAKEFSLEKGIDEYEKLLQMK